MATDIPDEELVRLLQAALKEMNEDPKVIHSPYNEHDHFATRMPHYLKRFRLLRQYGKL